MSGGTTMGSAQLRRLTRGLFSRMARGAALGRADRQLLDELGRRLGTAGKGTSDGSSPGSAEARAVGGPSSAGGPSSDD